MARLSSGNALALLASRNVSPKTTASGILCAICPTAIPEAGLLPVSRESRCPPIKKVVNANRDYQWN